MNTQEQETQQVLRDVMITRQPIQSVDRAILQCVADMKAAGYNENDILATAEGVAALCGWTWEQYNTEINLIFGQEKKTTRLN